MDIFPIQCITHYLDKISEMVGEKTHIIKHKRYTSLLSGRDTDVSKPQCKRSAANSMDIKVGMPSIDIIKKGCSLMLSDVQTQV